MASVQIELKLTDKKISVDASGDPSQGTEGPRLLAPARVQADAFTLAASARRHSFAGVWPGAALLVAPLELARPDVQRIYGGVPVDFRGLTEHPFSIPFAKGPTEESTKAQYRRMNEGAPSLGVPVYPKSYTPSAYRGADGRLAEAFDTKRPETDSRVNAIALRTLHSHRDTVDGTQEVNWGVVMPGYEKRYFRTEAPQSPGRFFEMLQHTGATTYVTLTNPREENQSENYSSRAMHPRKNTQGLTARTMDGISAPEVFKGGKQSGINFYPVNLHHVSLEHRTLTRPEVKDEQKTLEKPVKLVLKDGREVTCRIDLASHETGAAVLAGRSDVDLEFAQQIIVRHLAYRVKGTDEVVHRASHVEYTGWVDNGSMTAKQLMTLVETVRTVDGRTDAGKNPLFVNCIFGHGRTGTLNMCLFLADLADAKIASVTSPEGLHAMEAAILAGGESGLSDATRVEINKLIGLYRGQTIAGAVACNNSCNQPLAVYQFFAEYFKAAIAKKLST